MAALIPPQEEAEAERSRFLYLKSHIQGVEELGFEPSFRGLQGSLSLLPQCPVAFVLYVKSVSGSFKSAYCNL